MKKFNFKKLGIKKKTHDRILQIVEIVVIVFISLFCLVTLYQKVSNNRGLFGYRIFVIVSNSMKPHLSKGDVIFVKEQKYESIQIGDYLVYQGMEADSKGKIITHEVVNITYSEVEGRYIYYTKGSANIAIDPAVYQEQIYGTMIYKFRLISVISKIIRSTVGFILFILVPLTYIFITEIKDVKKEIKK